MKRLLALALLAAAVARAEPVTFVSGGLKDELVVKLDVNGQTVTGTFSRSEYDREHAAAVKFAGNVIPTPKGRTGIWLAIIFLGEESTVTKAPYNAPPNDGRLVWQLRLVKHQAHLFIPMQQRSYAGKTPQWIVADCDLAPEAAPKKP